MPTTAVSLRVLPILEVALEPVAALVNRAFATYHEVFKGERTSAEDYAEESGSDARVILIEDDGVLVATGMIAPAERFLEPEQRGPAGTARPGEPMELPAEHPWSGALYFGLAAVEPARMNGGFGRTLVRRAEEIARAEGYPTVGLGTSASSASSSTTRSSITRYFTRRPSRPGTGTLSSRTTIATC